MGTAVKHLLLDRFKQSFVILWHPATLTLSANRQSAWMSKITNDCLNRSSRRCFTAVPIWQQWASKGYSVIEWSEWTLAAQPWWLGCYSSLCSFDECRLSAKHLPTIRLTWAESPPVGCCWPSRHWGQDISTYDNDTVSSALPANTSMYCLQDGRVGV